MLRKGGGKYREIASTVAYSENRPSVVSVAIELTRVGSLF